MNPLTTTAISEYPFAKELITDARGRVSKVVLGCRPYRQLLELAADAGLGRAMKKVAHEKPLTREQALKLLSET